MTEGITIQRKQNYSYEAIDGTGKREKGSIQAYDKDEVVKYIVSQGWNPVSIDETSEFLDLKKINEINIGGIALADKVFFMKQFSVMVSAGLSITRTLEILAAQVKNPRFKAVLKGALKDISSGASLSSSFRKYPDVFDEVSLSLIEAGEQSGNLEIIFKKLAKEFENRHSLLSKVKSAMIYPITIFVIMVLVVVFIMLFVIPQIKDAFSEFGAKLPGITLLLIAVSEFMVNFYYVWILGLIILVFASRLLLVSEGGKRLWHQVQLKIPVLGSLLTKIQTGNFARIFELLLSSGVPILKALELTEKSMTNIWFKDEVRVIHDAVQRGINIAEPLLQSKYFPPILAYMVNVGQETGNLDEVLQKLVQYYDVEIEETTKQLSSMLEPVMLVLMGAIVGVIVVAVYWPIFKLTESVG